MVVIAWNEGGVSIPKMKAIIAIKRADAIDVDVVLLLFVVAWTPLLLLFPRFLGGVGEEEDFFLFAFAAMYMKPTLYK